ncbi:hypothetical protein [Modicisalibacter sp. MOD 31.J]|uniref:hypothetical protein n=1 Tax=Modicisalibacter sp. MOD 31.J TaxID=2831897 RepID=UPI001CCDB48D|nr:hypothetical protein [Modicisalibacter sp. MOD 31.J]MBZ9574509.1 hypothetical protein [Modicisalibacter sp. MOD 31.J]
MKRVLTVAASAVALVALSGCAGSPINYAQRHADQGHYDGNPDRSRALNVAIATGLAECENGQCAPLDDVARSKLPESMQSVSNVDMIEDLGDAWSVGHGVAQMAGMADALTGLSGTASGMLSIGSFMLEPSELDDPASMPALLAWMPSSSANSPEDARGKMATMLAEALPTGDFQGYQVRVDRYAEYSSAALFQDGHACNSQYMCAVDFTSVSMPAVANSSPDWLSGEAVYVWSNWERGATSYSGVHRIGLDMYRLNTETNKELPLPDDLNARAYLARVSENLPAWAYIYLPPTEQNNYPVMLNQGKPLLFVEPASKQKDIAAQ